MLVVLIFDSASKLWYNRGGKFHKDYKIKAKVFGVSKRWNILEESLTIPRLRSAEGYLDLTKHDMND